MIKLERLVNSLQTYTITAIIDTALCIGAGGSSGSLADKPIVRNAEGNLLIPASQLKGRLRHECEKIARGLKWDICNSPNPQTMCPQRAGLDSNFDREEYKISQDDTSYHCLICQIFGNPVLPSCVIFDDLICEEAENLPEIIRPGVTINRRRRTAEERKLYFLETSPTNIQLRFKGKIYLSKSLFNNPDYIGTLILVGLRHINALGGSKSAGLGWLNWELPALSVGQAAWEFLAKGVGNNEKD